MKKKNQKPELTEAQAKVNVEAEVIKILRAVKNGKKLKSYYQFWNWLQPYTLKLHGKIIEVKICDYLYRKKLVEIEKERGNVMWLQITANGKKLLAKFL